MSKIQTKTTASADAVVDTKKADETSVVTETTENVVEVPKVEENTIEDIEVKAEPDEVKSVLYKGTRYGFTADAPQNIRYSGVVYSREELLNNEDVLAELIESRFVFLKKM